MNVLKEKTHRNVDPISDFAVFLWSRNSCLWCLNATINNFYLQHDPYVITCGLENGLAPQNFRTWSFQPKTQPFFRVAAVYPRSATGRVWTRVCFSRSTRSDESRSGPRRHGCWWWPLCKVENHHLASWEAGKPRVCERTKLNILK